MLSRILPPARPYGASVKQVGFRARLFLILLGFALIPTIVLTVAWEMTVVRALPLLGTTPAMERIAETGSRAIDAVSAAPLTPGQRALIDEHRRALDEGLLRGRQMDFLMTRRAPVLAALLALAATLLMGLVASRVAGHLSRNLSRPLSELVGWTAMIGRGEALPEGPPRKGAPEFVVLRNRMREMSDELRLGRRRALEAERATALRESARQVAHEIKNPLTPIRFAIARLRREAAPGLQDTVDVLEAESRRLDEMARSFAQFGRLPEGPHAPVDLGELVRACTRSAVPARTPLRVDIEEGIPMVPGHAEALGRALTNVLLNAVEASAPQAPISVSVRRLAGTNANDTMVEIAVRDAGSGIPPARLERIWEPYVTHKAGGTGLGLAIVRQTVLAHGGRTWVDSTPGSGTTIGIVLPANDAVDGAHGMEQNG